jgi:hypothetical protein
MFMFSLSEIPQIEAPSLGYQYKKGARRITPQK